jgi:diguanylate cyclase (GGDEF)-like protein
LLAKNVENINFRKIMHIEKIDNYYEIINVTNAINKLLNQINLFYNAQKNMLRRIVKLKKHLETAQKIAQIFSWEYDCVNKNIQITHQFKKFLGVKGTIFKVEEFIEFFDVEVINVISKLDKNCNECKEFEFVHKIITVNNKEYYFKTIGKCIKTKNKHFMICVSLNITDDVKKQQKIEYLAYHDPLTSLPNRTFLKEQFQLIINMAKRENKKLAVLYLDMDNFKMINDTLGHDSGDKLLINVSYKLKTILRKSDVVARIGGDEFVIILNDISSKEDAVEVLNKLIELLKQPIFIKQTSIIPTFSIGCALYPDNSDNPEELLRYADIAMYEAKNKGKNNYAFIKENLKRKTSEFYLITNELKEALKNNELVLFYQPKIDITTNKVYGAEGLIRWNHPKKGLLTPFHFIPYAEKSNLITQIDRYVLKQAFITLEKWKNIDYLKDLNLAINISANEFRQKNFVLNLKNLLEEYKIDPSKLEIEITETLSMQDIGYTVTVLEEVKSLGFKIALDDFGTGYSSLNYLKKLPFDTLKIDQSFVRDLENDNDDLTITKMIVQIAKVLNKTPVAEGVENEVILKIVKDLGCELVQGYYYAKPLNEEEFIKYCKKYS